MPGVCLCHKEIDRFPSSSTAPKSEILGYQNHWLLTHFRLAWQPFALFVNAQNSHHRKKGAHKIVSALLGFKPSPLGAAIVHVVSNLQHQPPAWLPPRKQPKQLVAKGFRTASYSDASCLTLTMSDEWRKRYEAWISCEWRVREALQKPLLPSRMEQNCFVRFFLTTLEGAVFLSTQ